MPGDCGNSKRAMQFRGFRMPRYTIEICGPRNEGAIFPPLGYSERLRGRWDMAKTAHRNKGQDEAGEAFKALSLEVSVIPGLFISLDTDAKKAQIIDPLGETPDGRKIQSKIREVFKRFSGGNPLNCGADPRATQTIERLSIDQIKTWLFYMRTMVDNNAAVKEMSSADLPTIDAIKRMPGRRASDPACTLPQRAKSEQNAMDSRELYPWADEVPADGKGELAGAGAGAGGKGGKGGESAAQ